MLRRELADLVEANAWTYGPTATALRILRLTIRLGEPPASLWGPLLEECPRMAPLGYWLGAVERGGHALGDLEADYLGRERILVEHLRRCLGTSSRVLIAGHDREIEALWRAEAGAGAGGRTYRYLLLDGRPGIEPPGSFTLRRAHRQPARLEAPFRCERLEEALDWADTVVLAGFVMHRQNLLGPAQLRPLLSSARDQVEAVLLCTTNERRLTLGEGAPRQYRDDFRPYLWQAGATHLVSEWHHGAEGTALGWLPLPPAVLRESFGEELFVT